MSAPAWFDRSTYLGNKLAQLQATEPDAGWDANTLEAALIEAGYDNTADGLYRHFVDFGNAENVSPSPYFVESEYKANKLAQLQADEPDAGWTMEKMEQSFKDSGLSYWDHYTQFGMYEGVNPSANFDGEAYMAAKLAQLQADEPDAGWTMEKMEQSFKDSGLNPIEHYTLYGVDEGVNYTPVKPAPTPDFVLTTEIDNVTGTSNDDIFAGVASSLSSERTLNPEDTIQGGDGNDTLTVTMNGDFRGFTSGSVTGVENVALTNEGSIARTFTAAGLDGVNAYTLKGAVNLAAVNNADTVVNLEGQQKDVAISFDADAVKGAEDTFHLGVQGVGAAAEGSSSAVYAGPKVNGFEAVEVTATGDNYVDLSKVADVKSVTVSGAGNLDVNAVASTVTTVDASAMTGNLVMDATAATKLDSFTGGAGDDTLTIDAATANAKAVIIGGAGEDTLVLNATGSKATQYQTQGVETLQLGTITGNQTISAADMQDLNTVTVTSGLGADASIAKLGARDMALNLEGAGINHNVTLDHSGASAVALNGDAKATSAAPSTNALNVTLTNSASVDMSVAENVAYTGTLSAAKAESLIVDAQGALTNATIEAGSAGSIAFNAVAKDSAVTLNAAKAQQLDLTLDANLTIANTSKLAAVQELNAVLNGAKLDAAMSLDDIAAVNLSGNGSAILGALGATTLDHGIEVSATGLEDLTLDAINATDVSINAADLMGDISLGAITAENAVNMVLDTLGTVNNGSTVSVAGTSVNLDVSNVVGGSVSATVAAKTITFSGSELNSNTLSATVSGDATVNVTGGIVDDTVKITGSNATKITVTGDLGGGDDSLQVITNAGITSVDLSGFAGDATVDGTSGGVTITGGAGNDFIIGGTDTTLLVGGNGADCLVSDVDGAVLFGGSKTEMKNGIYAESQDSITGTELNSKFFNSRVNDGSSAQDWVSEDTLNAWQGANIYDIHGNNGVNNITAVASTAKDVFLIQNGTGNSGKTAEKPISKLAIHQFTVGEDAIMLQSQSGDPSTVAGTTADLGVSDWSGLSSAITLDDSAAASGELEVTIDWSALSSVLSSKSEWGVLDTSVTTIITLSGVQDYHAGLTVAELFGFSA